MAKPKVRAQSAKGALQEKRFVDEYLIDLNATRAARAIGHSEKSAEKFGCLMLQRPSVAKAVQEAMDARSAKTGVTSEMVVEELRRIACSNMLDYVRIDENGQADVDLSKITREQGSAIQEISVDTTGGSGDGERRKVLRTRVKLALKAPALDLLSKHVSGFAAKLEVTGPGGGPIATSVLVRFVDGNDQAS